MNAGQHLVALSGLPSGTAAQHLLAIQLGSGAGPAQTIYCSQTYSVLEREETVVTRRSSRPRSEGANAPAATPHKPAVSKQKQAHYAVFSEHRIYVVCEGPNELVVAQRRADRVLTRMEHRAEVIRKGKQP